MTSLKQFSVSAARPLPVIVLADVSGSMEANGKIQALNGAMREMFASFVDESDLRAQIQVAVITFGEAGAKLHQALAPATSSSWVDMMARGGTPMGAAFAQVRGMLEDRNVIPSRAYRPTLVLASDGQPTDAWQEPLKDLLASERGSKAIRLALAIGADADHAVLESFAAPPDGKVFRADEARQIRQFFRFVTMSVCARSRSINPNIPQPILPLPDFDL